MTEASQRKALDAVLKSAGVKDAPPLDRFFNFAIDEESRRGVASKRLETVRSKG